MTKRYIVIAAVVVLLMGIVAVALPKKKSNSPSNQSSSSTSESSNATSSFNWPTSEDFINQLTPDKTIAVMDASNTTVTSVLSPASSWFIVTMVTTGSTDKVKAIYHQASDGSVTLVLGPGSTFALSELDKYEVPLIVQGDLSVYNDE